MKPSERLTIEILKYVKRIFARIDFPKKPALIKHSSLFLLHQFCPQITKAKLASLHGYRDHSMAFFAIKKMQKLILKNQKIKDALEIIYRVIIDENASIIRQINSIYGQKGGNQ